MILDVERHPDAAAIILAGGTGSRMGGADKPALVVGNRTMLSTALSAVAGFGRRVVVGPPRPDLPNDVLRVQESPPGSGPLAAVAAGLAELDGASPTVVVVMASDLPAITPASVASLVEELRGSPADVEAVFASDGNDRVQFLLAAWRTASLRERIRTVDKTKQLRNGAMKSISPAHVVTLNVSGTDDCDTVDELAHARALYEPPASVPSLAEAKGAILAHLQPLPVSVARLSESYGAILAEPLRATSAMPNVDISAMDGYAVAGAEPWLLRGDVFVAGGNVDGTLSEGQAVRIATGAAVPNGATAVIRDEHVEFSAGSARAAIERRPEAPVRNDARRSGEDWQPGDILVPAGMRVGASVVSVAASGETPFASVRGPVRAMVTLTGDEIRREGPLARGQTRDSVGPVIEQFLTHCGIVTVGIDHSPDTAARFEAFLSSAHDYDLMVVVGATGGGAADQLRGVLSQSGAQTVVERVRCRPGGSQLTAVLPDGRVILGLPGNPYAALATLLTVAPTIVAALSATEPTPPTRGILTNASQISAADASRIVPVSQKPDGTWVGDTANRTAHVRSLVGCRYLAVVPPEAVDGEVVDLIGLPF